jgi:carbon-monoxide dehydrogenase large subunit
VDAAADTLGLDPLELRRRNLVPDDGYPRAAPSGVRLDHLSHQACLAKLAATMDYDALRADQRALRADGIHRGIGIAAFIKGTIPSPLIYGPAGVPISAQDGCTLRFEPSGVVTCLTGVTEQGQGTETILAQVVSSALGVAFEDVSVISGDTESMPYGGGTYGSRGAGVGGEAAYRAALALRGELLEVAAILLQSDADGLDIVAGDIVDREGSARLSLAELGAIVFFRSGELPDGYHPTLIATRRFHTMDYVFTNGIHGCHVEVDAETGFVRVLGYWVVEDCGRIINPRLVEEQVRGAVVTGLGDALYEHCLYDGDGQLRNGTLVDYLVPMAGEMPDIAVSHIETPTSASTLGAKGAGESGTAAAPGALFNAVNDALRPLGARVDRIPIIPPDVLAALAAVRNAG